MSHTLGPWKAQGTMGFDIPVIAPEVSLSQGQLVCRVNSTFYDRCHGEEKRLPREQVDSNALLIAAAPELLAATQAVFNHLGVMNKWGPSHSETIPDHWPRDGDGVVWYPHVWDLMQAIAKATGESGE